MKFLLSVFAACAMIAAVSVPATAQESAPSNVWGLGVNTGASLGGYAYYAVSSTIHVGSGVGFQVEEGNNQFFLGPYAKFLFASSGNFYPFVYAQFQLYFGDVSMSGLGVGGGLQVWLAKRVAVWGAISVLNLGFDPSRTVFGLTYPTVGVEFNI